VGSLAIILGTSRCGSTMLSRFLNGHPKVLSLNEFWRCFLDREDELPAHDMSGEEFWWRITEPASSYDDLIRAGIKKDESLKPFTSRFNYVTGMPPICRVLAYHTGGSPDPLYDMLASVVSAWPWRRMAEHSRALFSELSVMLGRPVVVERTGGSLSQVTFLLEEFSDARFIFLHRDGIDCALSMSRYPTLRREVIKTLAALVGNSSLDTVKLLPPEIRKTSPEEFERLLSPPFDPVRFMNFPIPISIFGGMWSRVTRTGTREIRRIPRDQRMILRYESLLTNTREEMTRLAEFLGVPAYGQWLDFACKSADPGHIGSAKAQLNPSELAELRAICLAGTRAFDFLEAEHAESAMSPPRS
jgi:Sulfotransferase family